MSKRKTIGVVIDTMDGGFQKEIVANIRRSAMEKDYNVLFASGLALLQGRNRDSQYNTIFRLLGSEQIDGIILVLSSLEVFYDEEAVEMMLKDYKDIPLVSISIHIEGAYSICLDNHHASKQLVEHCLGFHNYKKVAYVSGPLKNTEALARYETFQEVAKKYGINDYQFYEGDFMHDSGVEAAKVFAADPTNLPEVIIAANDVMASGVIMYLTQIGIKIPEQIAITGFDNIELASAFFPALTTVHQPVDKMTDIAFSHFEKVFHKIDVQDMTLIQGNLVIRESCGCINNMIEEPIMKIPTIKNLKGDRSYAAGSFEELLMKSKAVIVPKLLEALNLPKSMNYEVNMGLNKMFDALAEDAYTETYGKMFLNEYYVLVSNVISSNQVNGSWIDFINIMREYVIKLMDNIEIRQFLEDTFFRASLITGNQMVRQKNNDMFHFQEMYITSRRTTHKINEIKDMDELYDIIHEVFQEYGITQCYICLYDNPILNSGKKDFEIPETIKRGIFYCNGIKQKNIAFDSNNILPDTYLEQEERFDMTCMSLFSDHYQYGYIITSLSAVDLLLYESLRSQISASVRNIELFKRRKESDEILKETNQRLLYLSIRDELTGLLNRRGFFRKVDAMMKKIKKQGGSFALLFGDLDKLKQINDIYGHKEGDKALVEVGFLLESILGKGDIIARVSGDEFIIILKDISEESEAQKRVEDIRTSFKNLNSDLEKPYKISMSLGYCIYDPDIHEGVDDMIGVADKLLYIDKSRPEAQEI